MKDYCRKVKWYCFFVFVLLCLTGCGRKKPHTEEIGLEAVNQESEQDSDQSSKQQDAGTISSEETGDGSAGGSSGESGTNRNSDSSRIGNGSGETLYVYVCGSVNVPGVYELAAGARVYEAIAAAGGVTGEAAAEYVNQARLLEDGERIFIPTEEEAKQGAGLLPEESPSGGSGAKVNINTAGKDELMTLTGIGESKASSIISYREMHGRFRSIEDLMQIEGIKEGVFNKIKDEITV